MKKFFLLSSLFIIVANSLQAQTILLQENFSTASGTTSPAGWTVQTVTGDPLVDLWHFDNPGRRSPNVPVSGNFACFDSDKESNNGQAEEVYLTSPVFDATATNSIILEFDQYFLTGYGGACAVEVFNGTSWVSIYSNNSTTANPQHSVFDITSKVQNITNAQVRFKWTGNYSWFWLIDNIKITIQSPVTEQFTRQDGINLLGLGTSSAAWGDYDNDGFLDILLTGTPVNGARSIIYHNNGDNSFTEQTGIILTGVTSGSSAWGDYNNDDYIDLLITGFTKDNLPISKVYKNNGDNSFTEQTGILLPGVVNSSVAWGDYNNDGCLDILLTGADVNGNSITKIYRNNANNVFTEETSITLQGVRNSSVKWSDYNNDGNLDIILTGEQLAGLTKTKVYRNNGENTFTEQTGIVLSPVASSSVACNDYDNDGDNDILLVGRQSYPTAYISKIYRNNGDNTFSEQSGFSLIGLSNCSAAWGDYNNDGLSDLLLTGSQDGRDTNAVSKIYKNNNYDLVEQTDINLKGVFNSSVGWGDHDNDGDLDILLTGGKAGGFSLVYKNNNLIKNTKPAAPANIVAYLTGRKLNLSWDKTTDAETPPLGLTYNLRIGTTPGGYDIISPVSLPDGKRLIPADGNMGHNTKYVIDLSRYSPLPEHIYYSIQAIDNGFLASDWSPEKSEVSNFVADFLPEKACQNTLIQFQDKSYSIQYPATSYSWKFTEGTSVTTSTLQNPTYTFHTTGIFQVEHTITNSNNETTTRTKLVTVLPSPLAGFTATDVCQGVPMVFDNTTSANNTTISSWLWNFGDNTSTSALEEPGSHGYLNAGDYPVSLTASAINGCTGSIVKTVTVAAYPVAEITTNAPLTFCKGDSVALSVSYNSNYSYKWLVDGSYLTSGVANKYVAKISGSYSVEVVNLKVNCKTISSTVTVNAQNGPAAPFITIAGSQVFCQGDSVVLSATSIPGYTYQWRLNGGAVGLNSNQYAARNQGSYSLDVTNSIGCKANSANEVLTVINPLPSLSAISLSGPTDFCEGDSLIMSITATSGYSYQWRNDFGALTGGTTNRFAAKATGRYYLDIFNSKGCKISSPPVEAHLRTNPPVPVMITENFHPELCNIESPIILRVKDPVETFSYQWKRNGYPFNSGNQSYLEGYLPQGDYTVVANNSGCKNESATTSIYFENAPAKPLLYVQGPTIWYLACSNDSALQYEWYYNNNLIPGANKHIYVANRNLGQYYVSISNSTGCFTASDIVTIPIGTTGIENSDPFGGLKIYPNPTTGLFTLEMDNQLFGDLNISVITQTGQQVLKIRFEKTTVHFSSQVDLSGQLKGVYVLKLKLDKFNEVRRIVLQ